MLKIMDKMSSQKIESNNKKIKNIREETDRIGQQQKQQIAENIKAISNISNTTNAVTSNINENQKINKEILGKSIDIVNRYQQITIKTIKSTADNYNQLQNNILNTYQSVFSKFINDTSDNNNSYNFAVLEQLKLFNKINQNMIDSAINITRITHQFFGEYTETFNKSIELGQEYYSDEIKNYFGKKIERT
jgi:sugar-specific transcriptional regulator TrmB